jgi:hypothetical protein
MKILQNCFACYKHSDLLKKVITIFIIHHFHWMVYRVTHIWRVMGFPQISRTVTYQYRGANESSDFNQIVRDIHVIITCTSNRWTCHNSVWGSSWLWLYGSWIYNYLWNQCLSPLMLWVWISIRARCHFQQYFSYIVAVSFIGGGNQRTWKKPLTCRKSLTNVVYLALIEIQTHNISGDRHWFHK